MNKATDIAYDTWRDGNGTWMNWYGYHTFGKFDQSGIQIWFNPNSVQTLPYNLTDSSFILSKLSYDPKTGNSTGEIASNTLLLDEFDPFYKLLKGGTSEFGHNIPLNVLQRLLKNPTVDDWDQCENLIMALSNDSFKFQKEKLLNKIIHKNIKTCIDFYNSHNSNIFLLVLIDPMKIINELRKIERVFSKESVHN